MEHTNPKLRAVLSAFIAGCCLGIVLGAVKGGTLAASRDHNNFVSRDEYYRVCDEIERMSKLYYAERQRNVLLTGKHSVAMHIVEVSKIKASKRPKAQNRALDSKN